MQGSQLFQLIKSLNKHDMRELRKVVRSPYFNQREDVTQLFDLIDKTLNSKQPNFSKEKVFGLLFPNKKFDDVLMRQIMSYLYKIIQKYLITEGLFQNEMESEYYLIHALRQRNSEKILEKNLDESLQTIDNQKIKNAKYHHAKYKLLIEEYEYRSKKKRSAELNLQDISNELDYFYLSERLRQACLMYAHKTISKHDYVQPMLEGILTYVESIENPPLSVSAYYHNYKALTEPNNEANYVELKKIIIEQSFLFPENERKDLYIAAINYSIRKLNNGEKNYGLDALNLYRARMDNNVLLENGILPHYDYKNISMLALKLEEYDWAENFLNEFKQYLPEKDRENIFNYNLALFYFRKGKQHYGDAMSLLQIVNLTDVLYNLDARRLLAIIYFEHNDFQALQSHIESSKIYLHRHKDIGYHHDMYVNFFRFLEKIQKINMRDTKAKEILRGEMTSTQLLAERDWLINKLV
jgi:hypothetical protein